MKYRNKPVVREAVKFNGENFDEIREFMGSLFFHPIHNRPLINTLEGDHLVSVGDYIIKVVKGEFYPCKPDIFEMAYEPADNPDPRDELIKVYEEVIEAYMKNALATRGNHYEYGDEFYLVEVKGEMVGIRAFAEAALAQGAEIKKRMEEG